MTPQPSERIPPPPPLDDVMILRRIADRDETALATLYDRWVQQVYSLVSTMLHDPDAAEDVVEETFWQVWQRASSYDSARYTVATWLLTMSRNRALDRMRAKQRQRGGGVADRENLLANVLDLSDAAVNVEGAEQRSVLNAFRELPDDQRRALELAYYHGLSQSEISEFLNQSLTTVKTWMQMGMQTLRGALVPSREGSV